MEGHTAPPEGATVAETVATGYTFQGRLLRPALVRLEGADGNGGTETNGGEKKTDGAQSQLPLGSAKAAVAGEQA